MAAHGNERWHLLAGSQQSVAAHLAAFADYGVEELCLWPSPMAPASVEWLARAIELVRT